MKEGRVGGWVRGAVGAVALTAVIAACASAQAQEADKPAAAKVPAGGSPWSQKSFVHPPLKCMEAYLRIDEFPVIAWCFHGQRAAARAAASGAPVNPRIGFVEEYVIDAKLMGFNVLIDVDQMLPHCEKVGGMKLLGCAFRVPPEHLQDRYFKESAEGHPNLLGIVMDDDCTGIAGQVRRTAAWMKENCPHVMPLISKYPPGADASSAIRVLMTMNYSFLRGGSGEGAIWWYCSEANNERVFCNKNDMAMWQIYGGGNANPLHEQRFQVLTSIAYGAQGLVNFAYTPHRAITPMYHPGNPLVPKFKEMHDYVTKVVGRHLWGTRSIEVFHSPDIDTGAPLRNVPRRDRALGRVQGAPDAGRFFEANISNPTHAPLPGPGKLVVGTSSRCLVGLLTPEPKFFVKDAAGAVPEYFLMVDKRAGDSGMEPREVFVMLDPARVPVVEALGPETAAGNKTRKLVPAYKVRRQCEVGDGLLTRVPGDLEELLGGKTGLALYAEINSTLAALQAKIDRPSELQAAVVRKVHMEATLRIAAQWKGELAEALTDPNAGADQKALATKAADLNAAAEKASREAADAVDAAEKNLAASRAEAAREADRIIAAARAKAAELEKVLGAAAGASAIAREQADDTMKNLKDAIDKTEAEAKGAGK